MLFLFRSAPKVKKRIHSKLFRKFWEEPGYKRANLHYCICLEFCIIFSPKSMKTLLLSVDKCLYESIMCTLQVKKYLKGNKKISLYIQQCYVLSWSQRCNDIWNAESSVLVNYVEGSSVRCPMLKMSKLSITLSQEFQRSLKVKPSTF